MRLFDEFRQTRQASRLMKPQTFLTLAAAASLWFTTGMAAQAQMETTNAVPVPTRTNQPLSVAAPLPAQAPVAMSGSATNVAGTPNNTRLLTISECIQMALEHNLDIQIQRFNPIINQYLLDVTYGTYEPVFNFTGNKTYKDSPGGFNSIANQNVPSTINESDNYTPEVKGVLPTGLTYDMTGTWSRNRTMGFGNTNGTGPFAYQSPYWASDPSINLTQPLLRNFWIDNTRLQIQLNKAALKISEAALRLQIMASVTQVKTNYYNLLYARGNVEANATAYKLAEQLVTENVTRVKVGALAPLDEKQSESQAAVSLAAMQAAQQALVVQENYLKSLLTDSYSQWAGVTLLPAEKLNAIPAQVNLQESWRRAVTQRPELVEAKLRIEQQNVTLKYSFNQLFPELDVTGSYGRNATEGNLYDNFSTLRDGNHSFYSYGAFVSIPLGGNYSARSTYKSNKATLKQLLVTLKQVEQNILISVDNDVGAVRSSLQQAYATRDARVYAEDALAAEKTKLENGKSTSFIVLQLINNLTTAKVSEIQALANYNNAVAQLVFDEGDTLNVNNIQFSLH